MTFNSKALQDCFETVKPILEDINKVKDVVSEDIKNLEKYLCSINLDESLTYIMSKPDKNFDIIAWDEYKLISHCECVEELLIWDHKKKRLIFFKNEFTGTIYHEGSDTPVIEASSCKSILNKPLIETPFEIRKYVYENNHLTNLLQNIALKYDVHGQLRSKTST